MAKPHPGSRWTGQPDPAAMLAFLRDNKPAPSDRRLRLFAVACCRAIWPVLTHEASRRAVETAEAVAEGRAGPEELAAARALRGSTRAARRAKVLRDALKAGKSAEAAATAAAEWTAGWDAARATSWASAPEAAWDASAAVGVALGFAAPAGRPDPRADLLRCVVPNPYFEFAFDRRWTSPTVRELAKGIDANTAFDRVPILADALEEAGCEDADVLRHCREGGTHARGCWVVDAVLGKG